MTPAARLAVGLGVLLSAAPVTAASQILMLVVNGSEGESRAVETTADGRLVLARADLVALGVPVPRGDQVEVALDTLPGVVVTADSASQTLRLDFAVHDRKRNRIDLARAGDANPITPSSTGVLVNYDAVVNQDRRGTSAAGLIEGRIFAPMGTLSTRALANTRPPLSGSNVIRLETSFTTTDTARLRRYTMGDLISGGLQSSRSVRLAGVQATTDFGIRPDLITYPLPEFGGSAAVPSTVDVLVNGARVGGGPVAAGDFAVNGAPVVNGTGTVDVVVRDALGRETRTSFAVYGAQTLLAAGLSACTFDAGVVRRNYALLSNDYRFAAGTATCRLGVTDRLTIEGHGEATHDLALGGGGVVVGLGRLGVVAFGASGSTAATGRGTMQGAQVSIGYEFLAHPVSVNLLAVQATHGYRDIAARAGDAPSRSSVIAQVGFDLNRAGSLNLGFTRLDGAPSLGLRAAAFRVRSDGLATAYRRASIATGTYTVSVARGLTLYANGFRDFDSHTTIGIIGLSLQLGQRATANATVTSQPGGTAGRVEIARPVADVGDAGYRFSSDRGVYARDAGEARYRGTWGEVSGGIERVDHEVAGRIGLRGSLVVAGGSVLPGNTLDGSFAIVDAGLPGVAVLRDNRPAGFTDSRGRLLIPDLRPFESNAVAIDALSLPDDALADTTSLTVRPRDRSGVVARFGAHRVRATRVRLVDRTGVPLDAGDRATLNDAAESVPVGYDGEVFLTALKPLNSVLVGRANGMRCTVRFGASETTLPAIMGPFPCQ